MQGAKSLDCCGVRRAFRHAGDIERVQRLQPLTTVQDLDILTGRILIDCQYASDQRARDDQASAIADQHTAG